MTKKKVAVMVNCVLLAWYFLSMFGVKIGDKYLVEGAFREEWIFMVVPTITLILFAVFGKVWKYVNLGWLSLWFITQFLSHEWYTLFGNGFMGDTESKIAYFSDCIQIIKIQGRYVPDLYHLILHALIVLTIICVAIVPKQNRNDKSA